MPKKRAPRSDNRHRAVSETRKNGGNTLVGTLRKTYGRDFAAGYRSDVKLSTLLESTGSSSLGDLLRHSQNGQSLSKSNGTSAGSNTILSITSSTFEPALKSLAKK
jgi:hypothetical protein